MRTEIHPIRIPRRIMALPTRARQPEAYVVADTIPVEIRCYEPGEAPPTVRDRQGLVHRQADGRPYSPVSEGGFAKAWESLYTDMEDILRREIFPGRQGAVDQLIHAQSASEHVGRINGWGRMLLGNPRPQAKTGILREPPPRLREVIDDGRAEQARSAAFLSERIAMVGDTLLVRTGLPRIHVRIQGIDVADMETVRYLAWNEDVDWGEALMAGDFRIDRRDEAEAFKQAFAAALPPHDGGRYVRRVRDPLHRFEVVDHDALAACYERAGSETLLGLVGAANEAVNAMRFDLAAYPNEEIDRFVEARRLVARRDENGLAAWLDRIEETASYLPQEPSTASNGSSRWEAETGFSRATIRYRQFVVPKIDLDSGDRAALMAI